MFRSFPDCTRFGPLSFLPVMEDPKTLESIFIPMDPLPIPKLPPHKFRSGCKKCAKMCLERINGTAQVIFAANDGTVFPMVIHTYIPDHASVEVVRDYWTFEGGFLDGTKIVKHMVRRTIQLYSPVNNKNHVYIVYSAILPANRAATYLAYLFDQGLKADFY